MTNFTDKSFEMMTEGQLHKVAYRDWGPQDSSKVLICVHGRSRIKSDFDTLADELAARGHRVIAVDMPGRGDSTWIRNKDLYGYDLYETVCAHLISLIKAQEVIFMGTSMGGSLGLRLAAKGAPFSKLILNDFGPYVPFEPLRYHNVAFKVWKFFKTEEEGIAYIRKMRSTFGFFTDESWRKFARDTLRELPNGDWTYHYDPGLTFNAGETTGPLVLWDLWLKIQIPVLAMRGEHSVLLTSETAYQMSLTGPKAKIFNLANSGHCPGLTTPLEISTVSEFINE